jgi:esterase/lipase superfamily enzyme
VAREPESIAVSFVTLRDRTGKPDPADYFGGSRGSMTAGVCTVSFSPIWGLEDIADSAPFFIPDEKIELVEIQESSMASLYEEAARFPAGRNGNLVIYIHGYNIDFEKGCRRSALFQRVLGLQDRLLLFSWPADGNMLKYTWDEADLVWSVPHIARFLEELIGRIGSKKIDLVAHSLGARGAVHALARMAYRERQGSLINELVLIAPDIDADTFALDLPLLHSMADRITVYVSDNDKALRLSQEVHGYPRLGQAGASLNVLEGVETIDISGISTRRMSGHLYHLFNPEVIADLSLLLHLGKSAGERPGLQAASRNGVEYWQMIPGE